MPDLEHVLKQAFAPAVDLILPGAQAGPSPRPGRGP
jgi:hypothetical protein